MLIPWREFSSVNHQQFFTFFDVNSYEFQRKKKRQEVKINLFHFRIATKSFMVRAYASRSSLLCSNKSQTIFLFLPVKRLNIGLLLLFSYLKKKKIELTSLYANL